MNVNANLTLSVDELTVLKKHWGTKNRPESEFHPDQHEVEKKRVREARFAQSAKVQRSDYMPKNVAAIRAATELARKAEVARSYYAKRKLAKKEKDQLTPAAKLHRFNRKHKCPCHGLRFNGFEIKANGAFKYTCDRQLWPELTTNEETAHCANCQQFKSVHVVRQCGCDVRRCLHCLFQEYRHWDTTEIWCHCGKAQPIAFKIEIAPKFKWGQQTRKEFLASLSGIEKKVEAVKVDEESFPTLNEAVAMNRHTRKSRARVEKLKTEPHGMALSMAKATGETVKAAFLAAVQATRDKVKAAKTSLDASVEYVGGKIVSGFVSEVKSYFSKILGFLENLVENLVDWVTQHYLLIPGLIEILWTCFGGEPGAKRKLAWVSLLGYAGHIFSSTDCGQNCLDWFFELLEIPFDYIDSKRSKAFVESVVNAPREEELTDAQREFGIRTESHGLTDKFVKFIEGFGKAVGRKLNWRNFMELVKTFNSIFSGGKNIMTMLEKFAEFLPNFISVLFKNTDSKSYMRAGLRDMNSPFGKFTSAGLACMMAKQAGDLTQFESLSKIFDEAKSAMYADLKEKGIALDIHLMRTINEVSSGARMPRLGTAIPEEPFVLKISGPSGLGKTTLTNVWLKAFPMGLNKTSEELYSVSFVRSMNETWDGFLQSMWAIIYDDFNQDRIEQDLKELIILKTKARFFADFSSIDPADRNLTGVKGDVVAPKVVILNGNVEDITPLTLMDKQAINRRKDVFLRLSFNPGYNMSNTSEDWDHIKVQAVDCTYADQSHLNEKKVLWTAVGREGIVRGQRFIWKRYQEFIEKRDRLNKNLEEFNFDPEQIGDDDFCDAQDEYVAQGVQTQMKTQSHSGLTGDSSVAWYLTFAWDVFQAAITGAARVGFIGLCLSHLVDRFKYPSPASVFYLVGTAVSFTSLFLMLRAMRPPREESIKTEVNSGEIRNAKVKAVKTVVHGESALEDMYSNNTCTLKVHHPEGSITTQGVFIESNICMFNQHLIWRQSGEGSKYVDDGTKIDIWIQGTNNWQTVKFDSKRVHAVTGGLSHYQEKDLCLYKFGVEIPAKPSIIKHFFDGRMILTGRDLVMIKRRDNKPSMHYGKCTHDYTQSCYSHPVGGKKTEIVMHDCAVADIPSQKGDCGSLLFADDNLMPQKIVGINLGKVMENSSIFLLVTYEMLRRNIATLLLNMQEEDSPKRLQATEIHSSWRPPTPDEIERSGVAGTIQVFAVSSHNAIGNGKSKIRPSPLSGKITAPTTAVCIQDMRDPRLCGKNTWLEAINEFGKQRPSFPEEIAIEAVQSIKEELDAVQTIRLRRTLTVHEAINGIPSIPFIDRLDMTTSPGFPYTSQGVSGEKRQLFTVDDNGDYHPKPDLQEHIDMILDRARNGILPDYCYTACLKDERKSIESVAKGKVRSFAMNNVALAIVMRMFFLPIVAHLYQCRHKTFLSIGINKSSEEWDHLVRRVLEVSQHFYDMDYKKFDALCEPKLRRIIDREIFIEDWMNEDEKATANLLLINEGQALLQYLRYILVIYATKSGSTLTAPFNSLLNETYVRMAWIIVMPESLKGMSSYRKLVRTKNYGDDLVLGVHESVRDLFNDKVLAECMAQYAVTMTPGSKEGDWGSKSLEEFTFLKNKTRLWNGRYVPLAEDPCEPINWIRVGIQSPLPEKACEDNCNGSLRTLFFYGPEEFTRIRKAILFHRPGYNLITWPELWRQYQTYGAICDVEGAFGFGGGNMTPEAMRRYHDEKV